MRADDRRRIALALGVSAAVHLVILAPLLRLRPRTAPQRRPIELVLRELPRERPPAPPSPPAPKRPRPSADRAEPAERGARPARRGSVATPPRPPALAPAGAAPTAPAPGTREYLEAEGIAGPPGGRELRLGPVAPGTPPAGAPEAGPPGTPGEIEPLDVRAERIRARIDGQLEDTLAADRALVLPDTYWSQLGARLEDRFQLGWSVLERGSPDDAVVSGTRARQALAAWQRAAEAWGRTGRAPDADGDADGASSARGNPRSPGAPELMPEEAARTLFLTEVVTKLEIVLDAGGRISSVRVVEPSGNAAHDELALAHVRELGAAAGASLGPPPQQGRRTWWAVRTRFSMFPPVPVVGCSFDATFHLRGCFYPLKRTVKTRFQLERVWRGADAR